MKYFIGEICEVNGGMEYSSRYLFATNGNALRYSNKVVKDWRGSASEEFDKNLEGYWSGCTLICNGGFDEISEADFVVLKKYLAVL